MADWQLSYWTPSPNAPARDDRAGGEYSTYRPDGLDAERYAVLVHLVPPPARVLIVKGFARRYRTACLLLWGPEVEVGPLAAADGDGH